MKKNLIEVALSHLAVSSALAGCRLTHCLLLDQPVPELFLEHTDELST